MTESKGSFCTENPRRSQSLTRRWEHEARGNRFYDMSKEMVAERNRSFLLSFLAKGETA